MYKKKHRVISQRNIGFKQNYIKVENCSSDEDVEVVNCDSDPEYNFAIDSSSDCDGFYHLPHNVENTDWEFVSNTEKNKKNYRDEVLDKLKKTNLLDELTEISSESGQLHDFMKLLEHLRSKQIPCRNIVFVLILECARFQSCGNSVGMRYSELTKKFWSTVYRLCKGVGLKFFSEEKNWGQVVTKKCQKSQYNPQTCKINLAVPNEKIIHQYYRILLKVINPGKISQCLNLLNNKKDIIIMGDGKLISQGLTTNFEGDANLFGHENCPNLDDLITDLHKKLEVISKVTVQLPNMNVHDKFMTLEDLTCMTTDLIHQVKKFHMSEEKNENIPEKRIQ